MCFYRGGRAGDYGGLCYYWQEVIISALGDSRGCNPRCLSDEVCVFIMRRDYGDCLPLAMNFIKEVD